MRRILISAYIALILFFEQNGRVVGDLISEKIQFSCYIEKYSTFTICQPFTRKVILI